MYIKLSLNDQHVHNNTNDIETKRYGNLGYLRWSVEKIFKDRKNVEDLVRNDFNIAVSQTSQEIKAEYINIYHAN